MNGAKLQSAPGLPTGNLAFNPAKVTKNPNFSKPAEIHHENLMRDIAITQIIQTQSAGAIKSLTKTSLNAGKAHGVAKGTILFILPDYIIRPQDKMSYIGLNKLFEQTLDDKYLKQINELLKIGSDAIRATVTRAADWTNVPREMIAAVLQNENNPQASRIRQSLQQIERNLTTIANFLKIPKIGEGSTGLGNVKQETINAAIANFEKFYKRSALPSDVHKSVPGRSVQTDIFYTAVVLRDSLNHVWSQGASALRIAEAERYRYYPYFGGAVSVDEAILTMGRYNGFGNSAKSYGKGAMYNIQNNVLYFLEQ
jgi:hypothetical protein